MGKKYTFDQFLGDAKVAVRCANEEEWETLGDKIRAAGKYVHIPPFETAKSIEGRGGVAQAVGCTVKGEHGWSEVKFYLNENWDVIDFCELDFTEKHPAAGKKYVCVGYKKSERYFTLGKAYTLEDNGDIIADHGFRYKHDLWANIGGVIKFLSEYYDFIEVTGDSRYMIIIDCVDDVTTAKMIVDGKEVRVGTAKRNPSDQFDFAIGARYAFDRLWEKHPKENETERLGGFKIGDRVKYTNGTSYIEDGKIGTVRDFLDGEIGVEFDDNVRGHCLGIGENGYSCEDDHGWWCLPENLTKITEKVKPRKRFKVGTRVKYIGYGKPNGLIGTICVYDENLPGVKFDKKFGGHNLDFDGSGPMCEDGHGWWCWTSDLEEITEETVGGFKVGDRVVCVNASDRAYGKCGTVRVFWDNCIGVEFDESICGHNLGNPRTDYTCKPGHGRWFKANRLLHLHDPSAKTEFHVGDQVLCVEEDQRPYNRFGTVRYIDEENDEPRIGVEFDLDFYGHHLWFNGHKLLNSEHGWWCNTEWLVKLN